MEHGLASGCRESLQSPRGPSCPAHCNDSCGCAGRNTPVYSFPCHRIDLVWVHKLHPIMLREHLFTRLNLAWVESNCPGTGGGCSAGAARPCSWAMPCSGWHLGSLNWQRLGPAQQEGHCQCVLASACSLWTSLLSVWVLSDEPAGWMTAGEGVSQCLAGCPATSCCLRAGEAGGRAVQMLRQLLQRSQGRVSGAGCRTPGGCQATATTWLLWA